MHIYIHNKNQQPFLTPPHTLVSLPRGNHLQLSLLYLLLFISKFHTFYVYSFLLIDQIQGDPQTKKPQSLKNDSC